MAGAAYGYAQAILLWVFALLAYVGSILVHNGTIKYDDFLTAMLTVILGAYGVGHLRCVPFIFLYFVGLTFIVIPRPLSVFFFWQNFQFF